MYLSISYRNKLHFSSSSTVNCSSVSILWRSRGSSDSIASGYGLDHRAIEVRSQAESRDFSFKLYVQTGSPGLGSTQTLVQWVPGVLSPGLKRGRGVTLITHPRLVPGSWMSRNYTSSSPLRLHRWVVGLLNFLSILWHTNIYFNTSRYTKL
jgi:hypothetical protein